MSTGRIEFLRESEGWTEEKARVYAAERRLQLRRSYSRCEFVVGVPTYENGTPDYGFVELGALMEDFR